jgi:hypothetical protein
LQTVPRTVCVLSRRGEIVRPANPRESAKPKKFMYFLGPGA